MMFLHGYIINKYIFIEYNIHIIFKIISLYYIKYKYKCILKYILFILNINFTLSIILDELCPIIT